mmetsp:Transcript_27949/g.61564  ORF Transcript_27949/g.61564 Transcript_27949/m.61564 type:complete len:1058 (-) Transcript_27949:88-3261(-)|eukprot:CAMPEP_0168213976 /NCGR_PEP_ID=MMETSP0140_2-20121125/5099_1 /TAXON_ID=44445 /ORGANISM="Pseudo-nitzschia australis, Strain 10249 10 AB" /LENGTH=1057 /DNA_ID=CAMNT_0008140897 /DNA_START=116 /DNA_END=3289 /DNA_ORIENTATION=-
MVSLDGTASSDDGDYAVNQPGLDSSARFPLHDCCEFEDVETLRNVMFVPVEGDDDSDNDDEEGDYDDGKGNNTGDEEDDDDDSVVENASASSSSSDENDSIAAAHAAAIGHSPQPILHGGKVLQGAQPATSTENKNYESSLPVNGSNEAKDIENPGEKTETSGTADNSTTREEGNGEKAAEESKSGQIKTSSNGKLGDDDDHDDEDMDADNEETGATNTTTKGHAKKKAQEADHQHKHSKVAKKKRYVCHHNLNERDEDENTPIHVAIHCQKLEHVELLCSAGASLHKKNDGSPPIHVAISIGAIPQHREFANACVRLLYKHEADFAAKDDALHTPLSLACMYNLPEIVTFILSTDAGLSTLNARADRSQGRALHMAAKFDTVIAGASMIAAATIARVAHLHHPDGSVVNAMHRIPGFPGKQADRGAATVANPIKNPSHETVTKILVNTPDIEIDAQNSVGQTPLHIACARGNWNVVRLLLKKGASPAIADRRGFTPGQHAHKRGMPIPNDLLKILGGPPSSGIIPPPRDLIVDPDNNTIVITHELCGLHRTCPPIRRGSNDEPPPENVRRLHVLVDKETGILRTGEFGRCKWENEGRRAALVDVLKCHEYSYVESISQMCSSIPDHPSAIANLDADTTMSRWSFEAALRAAGSVCEAVDKVVSGDHRNAFCVVRPPGHHAGPRGIVRCDNDPDGGSHGFCFLNNVAIGAAYARSMYRNEGIQKIAIVDFDVHHGNGTEEIVRQLVPNVEKSTIRTPFAVGELATQRYRPWLDETDINNVFFASTHGYGARGLEFVNTPSCGWFYPASGKSQISDAINNPSVVESPNLTDFLLSQTWSRMGDDAKGNCCKIINCGLSLPTRDAVPGMQRLEVRDTYRKKILPLLREFDPDIIFISAGFDAHKKDSMNFGYVGMVEDDYEWVTEQLVRLANTCCNGRIVSVLEGGYKIHGGIVSPFARSVASHVRALVDGGRSRELYDLQDGEWESQFERHLIDERERKRQQKLEKMRMAEAQSRRALYVDDNGADGTGDDNSGRKRKRNSVDYRQLYEQMKREGFAA